MEKKSADAVQTIRPFYRVLSACLACVMALRSP